MAEGDEIPRPTLITIFLPKADRLSKEDILKAIKASNDLETERWSIVREETAEGRGKTLKILIDDQQREKIAGTGYCIRFLYYQVKVYGARKPPPKNTTSKGNPPTEDTAGAGTQATRDEEAMEGGPPEGEEDSEADVQIEELLTPEEEEELLSELSRDTAEDRE